MAIVYVAKTGLDTNDGLTPATAKLTLGGAKLILTSGGNTIYIGVGAYTEAISFDTPSARPITVTGDNTGSIFGSVAGNVEIIKSTHYNWASVDFLNNLHLKFSANDQAFINGARSSKTNIVLDNCTIYGGPTGGSFIYGTGYSAAEGFTVIYNNCFMIGTGFSGIMVCSSITSVPVALNMRIEINNCDFHSLFTKTTSFGGLTLNCPYVKITNSLVRVSSFKIAYASFRWDISDTTLFFVTTSTTYLVSYWDDIPITSNRAALVNKCKFKNVNIKTVNDLTIVDPFPKSVYSIYRVSGTTLDVVGDINNNICYMLDYYQHLELHDVIFENINGNNLTTYASPGLFKTDIGTLYNTNKVWSYKAGSFRASLLPIRGGLEPNSTYNVTVDYRRVNTMDGTDWFAVGLVSSEKLWREVFHQQHSGTPLNIWESSVKKTNASAPINTWYTETFSFTTPADITKKEYYFIIQTYAASASIYYNFELTIPRITKV